MDETDKVFHSAVSKLLTEIFDGPPGAEAYILNPGDPGFHRQLQAISASKASAQPIPGKPSIAAHVDHIHFGLSLLTRWFSGEENPWADADWNGSWKRNSVTEDQWNSLREKLKKEADVWQKAVAVRGQWNEMAAAGALSTIAHTAYHLGAIRQIIANAG
jgi:hypothetical protein